MLRKEETIPTIGNVRCQSLPRLACSMTTSLSPYSMVPTLGPQSHAEQTSNRSMTVAGSTQGPAGQNHDRSGCEIVGRTARAGYWWLKNVASAAPWPFGHMPPGDYIVHANANMGGPLNGTRGANLQSCTLTAFVMPVEA